MAPGQDPWAPERKQPVKKFLSSLVKSHSRPSSTEHHQLPRTLSNTSSTSTLSAGSVNSCNSVNSGASLGSKASSGTAASKRSDGIGSSGPSLRFAGGGRTQSGGSSKSRPTLRHFPMGRSDPEMVKALREAVEFIDSRWSKDTHYYRTSCILLLHLGLESAEGRHLEEALEDAREAVTLDPYDSLGHTLAAIAHFCLCMHVSALHACEMAIQLDPNDSAPRVWRQLINADASLEKHAYSEAVKYCTDGVRMLNQWSSPHSATLLRCAFPLGAALHRLRSVALNKVGRREESLADKCQAARMEPSQKEWLELLGEILTTFTTRHRDAARALELALQDENGNSLQDKSTRTHALLSLAEARAASAKKDYIAAVFHSTRGLRMLEQVAQPQPLDARHVARPQDTCPPETPAVFGSRVPLSALLLLISTASNHHLGQARELLQDAEALIKALPNRWTSHFWVGLAHLRLGDLEKSRAAFCAALDLEAGAARPFLFLHVVGALSAADRGAFDEAVQRASGGIQVWGEARSGAKHQEYLHEIDLSFCLFIRSFAMCMLTQHHLALEDAKKGLALNPRNRTFQAFVSGQQVSAQDLRAAVLFHQVDPTEMMSSPASTSNRSSASDSSFSASLGYSMERGGSGTIEPDSIPMSTAGAGTRMMTSALGPHEMLTSANQWSTGSLGSIQDGSASSNPGSPGGPTDGWRGRFQEAHRSASEAACPSPDQMSLSGTPPESFVSARNPTAHSRFVPAASASLQDQMGVPQAYRLQGALTSSERARSSHAGVSGKASDQGQNHGSGTRAAPLNLTPLTGSGPTTGSGSGPSTASSTEPRFAPGTPANLVSYSWDELTSATEGFSAGNLVGKGGSGAVYRGHLRGINVAVKRMHSNVCVELNGLVAELQMLGRIRHPHIVTLMGHCPDTVNPCIVYEFLEGGDLLQNLGSTAVDGRQPLDCLDRLRLAKEIASALAYLSQLEPVVIHRDLKPQNIMLDRHGCAKIADWGLAVDLTATIGGQQIEGSRGYLPPELVWRGELTTSADVYAFGIILLQLLTGFRLPQQLHSAFEEPCGLDGAPVELILKKLDENAGPWPVDLAERVAKIALRCISKTRERRPKAHTELLPELTELYQEAVSRKVPNVQSGLPEKFLGNTQRGKLGSELDTPPSASQQEFKDNSEAGDSEDIAGPSIHEEMRALENAPDQRLGFNLRNLDEDSRQKPSDFGINPMTTSEPGDVGQRVPEAEICEHTHEHLGQEDKQQESKERECDEKKKAEGSEAVGIPAEGRKGNEAPGLDGCLSNQGAQSVDGRNHSETKGTGDRMEEAIGMLSEMNLTAEEFADAVDVLFEEKRARTFFALPVPVRVVWIKKQIKHI